MGGIQRKIMAPTYVRYCKFNFAKYSTNTDFHRKQRLYLCLNNYEQHICKIENVKPGWGDKTNINHVHLALCPIVPRDADAVRTKGPKNRGS